MKQEEILQAYLQQIEAGTPLRQILAEMPAEDHELSELLVIATKTRSASHPILSQAVASNQRERIMARAASPTQTASHFQRAVKPGQRPFRRLVPLAFAAAAMMSVLVVVLFAALATFVPNANAAHKATLEGVSGIVEAAPGDDPNNWSVMSNGNQVNEGMRLRTRTDSKVTLRFFDGSQAQLGQQSELTLTRLDGSFNLLSGKSIQVRIRQTQGETNHQVVPFKASASFYEVLTPSGKAVVHGTVFNVAVETSGSARFAVSRGIVEVNQLNTQVFLSAGQTTVSSPDQALLPPSFEYSIQGKINAIRANQWTVNGVTFTVDPRTTAALSYAVEDWVAVRGRILADGSYAAERIANAEDDQTNGYFTGSVESMSDSSWTISGKTILVNASADISSGIKVTDPVKVTFIAQSDGTWLATSIHKLDTEKQDDDPTATPKSSGTTIVTATNSPEIDLTRTPAPKLTKTHEPEETERPDDSEEAHKTAQPTITGTILPSITPEGTETPEGTRNGCDAADAVNHKGNELAARWGVTYQEIAAWFCNGFGYGEIDLAYELARDSGKPVSDIFAMKASGQGWGQIKQAIKKLPQQPGLDGGTPQPSMTPGPKNKDDQDNKNANGNGQDNNGKKK